MSIRCADGSLRLWQLVVTPLGQMTDRRQLSVGMAVDITERKKAEEALVLSGKMFNHSYDSIIITDADANIIRVNPLFHALAVTVRKRSRVQIRAFEVWQA